MENEFDDGSPRATLLISRFILGLLTEEESTELDNWIMASDDNMELFEKLINPTNTEWAMQWFGEMNVGGSFVKLKSDLLISRRREKKSSVLYWTTLAASIVLIILGVIFWRDDKSKHTAQNSNATNEKLLVSKPARPMLIQGNGEKIVLDDQTNRQLISAAIITNKGVLNYENIDNTISETNTLIVPSGTTYTVKLPDGTVVVLNAESSLRFPVPFAGNLRRVTLVGEAFFEVSKKPEMPFVVKAGHEEIKVLGTSFNIKSYEGASTRTSLISGAVSITAGQESFILKPGQAFEERTIFAEDQQDALAWKFGKFSFNDEPMQEVLKEISRWYDIDVLIKRKIDERITGEILRTSTIQQVLEMLQQTAEIQYELENRILIIR